MKTDIQKKKETYEQTNEKHINRQMKKQTNKQIKNRQTDK